MLWVECGQLRERMGALFENIAVRYDCLSDHSTCFHFRFGSKSATGSRIGRSLDQFYHCPKLNWTAVEVCCRCGNVAMSSQGFEQVNSGTFVGKVG